jgi:diaminopimelate decarboxylase
VNASNGTDASLRDRFDPSQMREEAVVAGNLCESGDVFTRDSDGVLVPRRLEGALNGDVLAFCDAGAYGFSMASQYNTRLLPPEVLVEGDEARLVRTRQPYEELMRGME